MNLVRRAALISLAITALTFAGCAPKRPAPPVAAPPVRPLVVPVEAAVSPQRFVTVAASSALLSLRSSQLAESRTSNPALRAFAATSIADQRGIGAQLSFAGRRLDLLPAAVLMPRHQAMYDELSASAEFETTFRRQQRIVLAEAYALHRAFARRGSSPTLRPVAAMAEPVLRRHLAMLRAL